MSTHKLLAVACHRQATHKDATVRQTWVLITYFTRCGMSYSGLICFVSWLTLFHDWLCFMIYFVSWSTQGAMLYDWLNIAYLYSWLTVCGMSYSCLIVVLMSHCRTHVSFTLTYSAWYLFWHTQCGMSYGVATVSRINKMIGLFCRKSPLL